MVQPDEAPRPADASTGSGAPLTPEEEQSLLAAAAAGQAVSWWAERQPDRLAVVSAQGQCTFAALDARANQLARALRGRGLTAGDAVALMCTNRIEFCEVWAACQRAGLRVTTL